MGGERYGIGINLKHLDSNDLEDTIIHEVVHFQGIYGHGSGFKNIYDFIKIKMGKEVNNAITNGKKQN